MSETINDRKKQLNIAWVIIGGVCAILALIVSAIALHYQLAGVDQANTWKSTFYSGQSVAVIETAQHWDSGKLYYGVNQTTGTPKTTKYDIYWKKSGGTYVKEFSDGYCSSNNTYYGAWYMHTPNGTSQYVYKLVKKTNLSTKSIMLVDLMVV